MSLLRSQKSRDFAGCIAAIVLSAACLIASIYHTNIILDLKHHGHRAVATVAHIERGAKNSKWAVYRYATANGRETTARDKFQQYIKRVHKGDSVTIIYRRDDVDTVTADLGLWIWQAPAIFFCGFLLLAIFAILIWRHRAT